MKMGLISFARKLNQVIGMCCAVLLAFPMGLSAQDGAEGIPAKSEVFPISDEKACYLIEHAPNLEEIGYPLDHQIHSKTDPQKWSAIVEVPAYIELFDVARMFSGFVKKPEMKLITRDGMAYKRFTFRDFFIYHPKIEWSLIYSTWIPRPDKEDRKKPGVFAWRVVTPDGVEKEQAYPIKLLDALPDTTPPKRVHIRWYTVPNTNISSPEKLDTVLEFLSRVGATDLGRWQSKIGNLKKAGIHEKGMRIAGDQAGVNSWPALHAYYKAKPVNPEYQNYDRFGKACSYPEYQYLIDTKGKPIQADLDWCRNEAKKLDVFSQDLEFNLKYLDVGFSPAGIKAFARRFGVDAEGLTPQVIWEKYRKLWGDFRAEQYLAISKMFYDAAKEGNPDVRLVWLPGSPYTTTDENLMSNMIEMGNDPLGRIQFCIFAYPSKRIQECMDVYMPMWYGHGANQVKEGFEQARAISQGISIPLEPCFLGQGRKHYYSGGDSGKTLRAMYWAVMLGGAKGYAAGWQCHFSPLQFSWIARAHREIGQLEDILLDGKADPDDVSITPLPKNRMTVETRSNKKVFTIPDFHTAAVHRAFALGNTRLIGVINVDATNDLYYKVKVNDLPRGKYCILDVSENEILRAAKESECFTEKQLEEGITMMTPAQFGVRLLLITPADKRGDVNFAKKNASSFEESYKQYQKPDKIVENLAEKGQLRVSYDITGPSEELTICVENAVQKLWIRPDNGAKIGIWKLRNNDNTLLSFQSKLGLAGDNFWYPVDARWSGEEKAPYKLVDASIENGKAKIVFQHTKKTASIQDMVLTKTFVIPENSPEIEVNIKFENLSPTPVISFSYWCNNHFTKDLKQGKEPEFTPTYLETKKGVTEAPLTKSLIWKMPGGKYVMGSDDHKYGETGATTANWIAQRNPETGDYVSAQILSPNTIAQFYSWRNRKAEAAPSMEWMTPVVDLPSGKTWEMRWIYRYIPSVEPEKLTEILKNKK